MQNEGRVPRLPFGPEVAAEGRFSSTPARAKPLCWLCPLRDIPHPHDVPRQADLFHHPDAPVGDVDFPPAVALAGDALVGVVVVVPAFAEGEDADPPEVAAVVGRLVVASSPTGGSPS